MVSTPVGGRYALYKEGSDQLVRWVARTAIACQRSILKRSDGKVSTGDLLKCAQLISTWKAAIDVPSKIVELAQDVIVGRSDAAKFYSSQENKSSASKTSDDGHVHFIEVLKQVHDMLCDARDRKKSKMKKDALPVPPPKKEVEIDAGSLSNLFNHLQVEEPDVQVWSRAAPKQTGTSAQVIPEALFLEVDEMEEKRFALWCFLEDVGEMRALVRSTWQEHKEGKVGCLAASSVTEVAFGIIRRAEAELVGNYPSLEGYPAILECLNLKHGWFRTVNRPSFQRISEEDPNGTIEELKFPGADLLYADAAFILHELILLWRAVSSQVREKQDRGEGSSAWRYEAKAPGQHWTFHPFGVLLYKLFPDFYRWTLPDQPGKCVEYTRTFQAFITSDDHPGLSLVVFTQCYMDINELMEGQLSSGHDILEVRSRLMQTALTSYVDIRKDMQEVGRVKELDIAGRLQQRMSDTVTLVDELNRHVDTCKTSTLEPYTGFRPSDLFKSLPAVSRELTARHQVIQHHMNIRLASSAGVLVCLAYLYRAAKAEGLLKDVWVDMEWLLKAHSKDRLYLEGAELRSDILASLKRRWHMAHGASASKFSSRDLAQGETMYGPRQPFLYSASELVRSMSDYKNAHSQENIDADGYTVDKILGNLVSKFASTDVKSSMSGRPISYTGFQLLQAYKKVRVADETAFGFNYVAFWVSCATLLKAIQQAVGSQLPETAKRNQFSFTIDVLEDAVPYEGFPKYMESTVLGQIAKILDEHIKLEGGKYVEDAKGWM